MFFRKIKLIFSIFCPCRTSPYILMIFVCFFTVFVCFIVGICLLCCQFLSVFDQFLSVLSFHLPVVVGIHLPVVVGIHLPVVVGIHLLLVGEMPAPVDKPGLHWFLNI